MVGRESLLSGTILSKDGSSESYIVALSSEDKNGDKIYRVTVVKDNQAIEYEETGSYEDALELYNSYKARYL